MTHDPWVGTWRPHRPRMPIAAMYNSPGPKYMLQGNTGYERHDLTKYRAPAYSLAKRLPGLKDPGTPGPKKLPEKITRFGVEKGPLWSMGQRLKDFDPGKSPGPGKYKPENGDRLAFPSVPAYSLAKRTLGLKLGEGPGPARYQEVKVFGPKIPHLRAAPAYSMGKRLKLGSAMDSLGKSPGPCVYDAVHTDLFKVRAPRYTMLERNQLPGDNTLKPGPNVNLHKPIQPKYTFGVHHSDYLAPLIVTPTD
ncbi:outer dense fiber protein 3-B [Callorhinchus milii]|uniref:outer dense fiber protein 3-B n=1 Tax=Callorhinchus milii TaxID=7868 RepID=UPI001C3F90CE|nr:outer dense fiber protein 3-B [Callorhinchus milii]